MRKKILGICVLLGFGFGKNIVCYGKTEIIDPFVNPIELVKIYEQRKFNYLKRLEFLKVGRKKEIFERKPKLFNISIPPFEKLIFQGLISKNGTLMVVAVDPTTGKIYFLKKGDPVDVNAKIVDIMDDKVVIRVYNRKNGKLIYKDIEINLGDIR